MEARLIATAGPLKGTVFSLSEQETYIGRNPDNLVWIHDPNRPTNRSVSRRHCLIRREAGQFSVRDLDSLNGTFVNGATVKEQPLEDGDQIAIGDSVLVFAVPHSEPSSPVTTIQLDDSSLATPTPIRLPREDPFNMVGESAAMNKVYQFIARVAPSDATVLIRGESGTGKELVASAIHQKSHRARKEYLPINCGIIRDELAESELRRPVPCIR